MKVISVTLVQFVFIRINPNYCVNQMFGCEVNVVMQRCIGCFCVGVYICCVCGADRQIME